MRNWSDKVLDKREKIYKKKYKKIRFLKTVKITSLSMFFEAFFSGKRTTYFAEGRREGERQCFNSRNRSYIDAYMCCIYYFPKITFREMYRELQKCCPSKGWYDFFICPYVGRSVLSIGDADEWNFYKAKY